MKTEDHLESFKEHKETIFDWALKVKGLKNSQRIIGLHTSRAIVELLSLYLHESHKIDAGMQINHRWFKSERVEDKLPEFRDKEIIIPRMIKLELISEDLSYGAPKPISKIKEALELFRELEERLNKLRGKDE